VSTLEPLEARTLFTVTTFTIDTAHSSITASGTIAGATLTPQATGSLVTSYAGSIVADLLGGSIKFTNASSIKANPNPNTHLNPGNTTANYGGKITAASGTAFAAIRNLVANLGSAALTLGAGGTFTTGGEVITLTSAKIDFAGPVIGSGSWSLAGASGNNQATAASKLVIAANGTATLTIPVSGTLTLTTVKPNDTRITLAGQWVATAHVAPGSISGNVFKDVNGNGARNTGDNNFPGVKVFLDKNKNGKLDSGEVSTTTDASGNYKFSNLLTGAYRVAEVVPSGGYRISSPATGFYDVPLAPGASVVNKVFANTRTLLITGTVFNDKNANGVRNTGEPGLSGWKLFIDTNNNGKLDIGELTTTTAADGTYRFIIAPPTSKTTYHFRQSVKAHFHQTLPAHGAAQTTVLAASGRASG